LPLVAELKPEPRLALALERGDPPGERPRGPLAAFADGFLSAALPAGGRTAA
jgi:hypothetical protein